MEASMLVIRVLVAAGIAVAGVSPVRVAAADSGKQTLVNRNESPTSETDSIGDREQLRRYFLQSR
jgi:hypothetical protein